MQSNFAKVAVVVVAVATVIILFVVLGGDDDSSDTTTTQAQTTTAEEQGGNDESQKPAGGGGGASREIPRITIVDGEPEGGVQDLEFTQGGEVTFEVLSDAAAEIHVHGYDIPTEVEANKVATISFPADLDGVFEVEIEDTATPVAELTVNPG
jgi:hypothetical protein